MAYVLVCLVILGVVQAQNSVTEKEDASQIQRLEKVVHRLSEQILVLQENDQITATTISVLQNELNSLKTTGRIQRNQQTPDLYIQTSFGCYLDTISLSCNDDKTIDVTTAYYGQNYVQCEEECCAPTPSDCQELMEEHSPGDWAMIQQTCNNRTACEVQNLGGAVPTCADPYVAEYAVIYYACHPVDASGPIAFTAYATTHRDYDSAGELILFDGIVSNVGSCYDAPTSTFTAPRPGLYAFYVAVKSQVTSYVTVDIMLENEFLVTANANDETFESASNLVLVECQTGDRVWVRSKYNDDYSLVGDTDNRYSSFSGFIIHSY